MLFILGGGSKRRQTLPAVWPPVLNLLGTGPVRLTLQGPCRSGPKATRVPFSSLPARPALCAGVYHLSYKSHFRARGTARLCASSRASQAPCLFRPHLGAPRAGREPCTHRGASAWCRVLQRGMDPCPPGLRPFPIPRLGLAHQGEMLAAVGFTPTSRPSSGSRRWVLGTRRVLGLASSPQGRLEDGRCMWMRSTVHEARG